jgi:hypothetical protein
MSKERLMAAITNYCHETKGLFPKNTDAVLFTDIGANVPIEIIQRHAEELGYNRNAESEKNRVANDALNAFINHPGDALHAFKHLYDLGYLRKPSK